MSKTAIRILSVPYLFTWVLLLLYSYTQVDLNMTFSGFMIWQNLQTFFRYIGYYNRPLSTAIYITILLFMYGLYFLTLALVIKQKIQSNHLWRLIIIMFLILIFSYPAFSYDIFNYMLYPKIILVYGRNPFLFKPLDFLGVEPWLSFMRWTHVTSPYTPVWVLYSIFPYIMGFQFFILTLFSFKLFIGVFYLLSSYFVYKCMEIIDIKNRDLSLALFAFNPLVITESVISPHNDIMMVTFSVISYYLYLKKDKLASYLILALSVSVKLMTIFLYPVIMTGFKRKTALLFMFIALMTGIFFKEPLPWYFLWVMPFAVLQPFTYSLMIGISGISISFLALYAPYLYFGEYSEPMIRTRLLIFTILITISIVCTLIISTWKRFTEAGKK